MASTTDLSTRRPDVLSVRSVARKNTKTPVPCAENSDQLKLYNAHLDFLKEQAAYQNKVNKYVGYDEIYQIASIAMYEACGVFDKARGVPFKAYAAGKIYFAVKDAMRKGVALSGRREQNRGIAVSTLKSDNWLSIADKKQDFRFDELVCDLPPRHRVVLKKITVEGCGKREVARGLGLSCFRVNAILQEAINLLRQERGLESVVAKPVERKGKEVEEVGSENRWSSLINFALDMKISAGAAWKVLNQLRGQLNGRVYKYA